MWLFARPLTESPCHFWCCFSSVASVRWWVCVCVCLFYVPPCPHNCTMIGSVLNISTYKVYITSDYSGIELPIHCVPDARNTNTSICAHGCPSHNPSSLSSTTPQLKCDFLTAKILILRSVAIEILDYSNQNNKSVQNRQKPQRERESRRDFSLISHRSLQSAPNRQTYLN